MLVADGLVWTGDLVSARDPGITQGRDPRTGEVKRTRPADQEFFQAGMGHHRCYRNKATDRYLVLGRSGVQISNREFARWAHLSPRRGSLRGYAGGRTEPFAAGPADQPGHATVRPGDRRGQPPDVPHLFSAAGFLDDSWWHRTYWLLGTDMGTNDGGWPNVGNQVPAGRLLVLDEEHVYGFGRNRYFHTGAHVGVDDNSVYHYNPGAEGPRSTQYQAFAILRNAPPAKSPTKANAPRADAGKPAAGPPAKPAAKAQVAVKAKAKPARSAPPAKAYLWNRPLPILARAIVLAGDRLLLAGPPDLFQADDPVAAIEGRTGGKLLVLSASDGETLAEYPLDSPPVFDGLAVADGKLYVTTMDGKVHCFQGD